MFAHLFYGLALLSSLLFTQPVVAQSPYFNQYIDHAKFVELSPQDQRDFLLALMQTVADLEQKAILSGRHLTPAEAKKTVHQRRWEQVRDALQRFQQLIVVPQAHATDLRFEQTCFRSDQGNTNVVRPVIKVGQLGRQVPQSCLFGSYRSSYVRSNGQTYCQRPGCSIDPQIRSEYAKIAQQGGCKNTEMACNPALFGLENSGQPTCVPLDITLPDRSVKNNVENASLACLIAVTNDANKDTRLQNIAESIKTNRNTAIEFNRLLHSVSNLCICDGEVGNDVEVPEYLQDMSNDYSQYVKDHRTCNALLSQTSLVLSKFGEERNGCVAALLPSNLSQLSSDLRYINNFSTRFYSLVGSNFTPGSIPKPVLESAMARYNARWVVSTPTVSAEGRVTRVAENVALDNVAEYMTPRSTLKSGNDNRWCPLNFPDPRVSEPPSCAISNSSATRAAGGKVSVSASVTPTNLPTGARVSAVVWKVNANDVAGQTSASLAATDLEIPTTVTSIPLIATLNLSQGTPITCFGTASFPAAPTECAIAPTVTYNGDNATISVAVTPANSALVVKFGDAAVTKNESGKYEKTVPISQGPIAVTASAAASGTAAAISCNASVPLNRPCVLTIDTPTEEAGKLKASVSLPSTITGATVINWTPAAPTTSHTNTRPGVATSVTLTFDKPAPGTTQKIVASAVVTTGDRTVTCRGEKELAAAAAATASCDPLTIVKVPTNDGKFSVSASIPSATGTKAPADGTQPSFTGLSFTVDNNAGTAVVDAKNSAQTIEITGSYTGKDGKAYSCKASVEIPAKARAETGGGAAPQQQGPMVTQPAGGSVFLPGLR